ncbi:MAG: hypothetical protein QXF41_02360 [Candidatus Micrarchaeaceae archaeon]
MTVKNIDKDKNDLQVRRDANEAAEVLVEKVEAVIKAETLVEKFDALLKIFPLQSYEDYDFNKRNFAKMIDNYCGGPANATETALKKNILEQMEHYSLDNRYPTTRLCFRFSLKDSENEKLSKILRSSLGVNHEDEYTIYYVNEFIEIGKEHVISFGSEGFAKGRAYVYHYIRYDKTKNSFEIGIGDYYSSDEGEVIEILHGNLKRIEEIFEKNR